MVMISKNTQKAQTILEFTATFVIACVIFFCVVELFRWGMMDMAERRYDHDALLKNGDIATEDQLNPNFHQVQAMDFSLAK
ncbi:MAG: hypothetical protein V2A70_04265 [Candidatus Omnitrophota bacterium]